MVRRFVCFVMHPFAHSHHPALRFDQVLPKILAREEAAFASQGTPAAPTMQAESSTPVAASGTDGATSTAIKAPRASEWSLTDFVNLLQRYVEFAVGWIPILTTFASRIAQVHGPDLDRSYQRDINFRTIQASSPELAKFSYKHCYKTFRAYAKRIDGFEALPLSGKLNRSPRNHYLSLGISLRSLAETRGRRHIKV